MNTKFNTAERLIITIIICTLCFCGHLLWERRCEQIEQNEAADFAVAMQEYTEVEMNVSAYCPCEKCCENFADGITASGSPATGKLIAAPRNYAFGTKMDVPGYGVALVLDRGGVIKGNKIDLLFPTHQEALNWGRQYLTVNVYAKAGK